MTRKTWAALARVPNKSENTHTDYVEAPSTPTQQTTVRLKGPEDRHSWRRGLYDRRHGKEGTGREYRYVELEQYDYDEMRLYYWLDGFSKMEADLLARRAFEQEVQWMERWGDGQEWFVGVVVTAYADEEHEQEVGKHSVWSIEWDAGEYFDEVARECAHEAISGALSTLKERREKLNTVIAKLEAAGVTE